MTRKFLQRLGLLGLLSLLSYAAAVLLAPLAYPGYNWVAQAVSDLSADSAPSRTLWNQLACLYVPCGLVSVTTVCACVQGRFSRTLRVGVEFFTAMQWISAVGYAAFPLSAAGLPSGFQNVMHLVVTAAVVLLSLGSLACILCGGRSGLRRWAIAALAMLLLGAIGTGVLPGAYFGIPERFSVFAISGFNAVLGIWLYRNFDGVEA